MDVFAIVGIPFAAFVVAFAFAGYSIGGSAAVPDGEIVLPSGRRRTSRAALLLCAAAAASVGALTTAADAPFAHLTNASYAIEPAALIFVLEGIVDVALIGLMVIPGWSMRRAWIVRAIGLLWLCSALPTLILADPGSTDGSIGLPSLVVKVAAFVTGTVLLWLATLSPGESH